MSILNLLANSDINIASIRKQFEFVLVDSAAIASSSKLMLCFIQDPSLLLVSLLLVFFFFFSSQSPDLWKETPRFVARNPRSF